MSLAGRLLAVFGTLVLATITAKAADLLDDFHPSHIESAYGTVDSVEFETKLIILEPGALAYHSNRTVQQLRFAEVVWIIGFKTVVLDAQGAVPPENYLCHTFFGDQRVDQQHREMRAVYTEPATPEVHLPEGFGVRLTPDDDIHWTPMFVNRGQDVARVRMKVELQVIRERNLKRPLRALYSTLRSVQVPHLFFVPPGRHLQQSEFRFPDDRTIHFMGPHLHPHGTSVELFNVSRQELVWKGTRIKDQEGRVVGTERYSSIEGYTVRAGETFRLTSVYDNPTDHPIDAMAGLFIFYSKN